MPLKHFQKLTWRALQAGLLVRAAAHSSRPAKARLASPPGRII
jgi:hypothetical protein